MVPVIRKNNGSELFARCFRLAWMNGARRIPFIPLRRRGKIPHGVRSRWRDAAIKYMSHRIIIIKKGKRRL
jgi:hypothetical protein